MSLRLVADAPSDGGWVIGFNAATEGFDIPNTTELYLYQFSGSRQVCIGFQTASGTSDQCAGLVKGQRDFTATAQITGLLNADFSAKVTIKFNDGAKPATVTINVTCPIWSPADATGQRFLFWQHKRFLRARLL